MLNYKTVLHQSSNQPQPVLFYPLQVQFHFYSVAHSLSHRKKKDGITFILHFSGTEREEGWIYHSRSFQVSNIFRINIHIS